MAIVGYPLGMYSWNATLEKLDSAHVSPGCHSVAAFIRFMDPKEPADIAKLIRYDHLYELCEQSGICMSELLMHLSNCLMHAGAIDFACLPDFEVLRKLTDQDAFNKLCAIMLKETDKYV